MSFSAATTCHSKPPFSTSWPQRRLLPPLPAQLKNPIGFSFRPMRSFGPNKSMQALCLQDTNAEVVTGESWDKLIVKSDTPVLVEFYASWCGPCRMVHRVIDEIATDYSGKLKCFVLNADNDSRVAEDYEIKAVPVVMLFKNGQKCETVVGTMPKEFYVAAIDRVLAL